MDDSDVSYINTSSSSSSSSSNWCENCICWSRLLLKALMENSNEYTTTSSSSNSSNSSSNNSNIGNNNFNSIYDLYSSKLYDDNDTYSTPTSRGK